MSLRISTIPMLSVKFRTIWQMQAAAMCECLHCLYLAMLDPILRIDNIAQMIERRYDHIETIWQC